MTPYLTSRGKAALAVALVWLSAGTLMLVFELPMAGWPLVVAATGVLYLLVLAFFLAIPLARVVESELFSVDSQGPDQASGVLMTHQPAQTRVVLRNTSGIRLRKLQLRPELSTALFYDQSVSPWVELPPTSEASFEMAIRATRSGRWMVHGFHLTCRDVFDFFAVSDYVSCPRALKFLPRGIVAARGRRLKVSSLMDERVGQHEVRKRGFGTDLREIRDHQHGDPFRNIAWKATARTGKLMVREFESELSRNTYLLLDVSATMRGSVERGGKLEHAVRLACNFARIVLKGNDRCGLITFDEKIYGHMQPREGAAHLRNMTQHLIGISNVVDGELSELDEQEVIEALVRYLLLQERLDFRRRAPRRKTTRSFEDVYDVELLNRWLKRVIPKEERRFDDPSLNTGVLNYDELSLARRYCHLRGVEIPYRAELRYGTKEKGLVEALEVVMRETRHPHVIIVISDLTGLVNTDQLQQVLTLARKRRHKLGVLAPFTPDYVDQPVASNEEGAKVETPQMRRAKALHDIFSAAEARPRRAVKKALRKSAVPVIDVSPNQDIVSLVNRLGVFR